MTNSKNTEIARQGLFAALKEAQDMVRSYDTKAQPEVSKHTLMMSMPLTG